MAGETATSVSDGFTVRFVIDWKQPSISPRNRCVSSESSMALACLFSFACCSRLVCCAAVSCISPRSSSSRRSISSRCHRKQFVRTIPKIASNGRLLVNYQCLEASFG